ncbi:MAG TPA: class E sortase [Pseudonocardiaceae bacterium]
MTHVLSPTRDVPPPRRPGGGVLGVIRGVGELLITLGLVVLLFIFYEVYVTDWLSAQKQHQATSTLDQQWRNQRGLTDRPIEGSGIAKIYIPSFGPDFVFTILEGTTPDILAVGPGHYVGTAMPGEPGDFAVAGHRVGKGSPFNDLDLLASCDSIVVETVNQWFVYRVLPLKGEAAGWSAGKGASQPCTGAGPLPGPYRDVVGKEVVLPAQTEVIAPIPGHPGVTPPADEAKLITLTTCHPQFSARERLIIHGVQVAQYPKAAGERPAELTAG